MGEDGVEDKAASGFGNDKAGGGFAKVAVKRDHETGEIVGW